MATLGLLMILYVREEASDENKSQMIPSQQAMMLEAAMAFEHLIKNPKAGSKVGKEVRRRRRKERGNGERGEKGMWKERRCTQCTTVSQGTLAA